jgi:hypothetical protein
MGESKEEITDMKDKEQCKEESKDIKKKERC